MKKLIFIGLLLLLTKLSLAGNSSDTDNKNSLDSIIKLADGHSKTPDSSYVFRYNAAKFNIDTAAEELNVDYNIRARKAGHECRYNIVSDSRANRAILRGDNSGQNYTTKIAEILDDLSEKNQLLGITSALWDGQTGAAQDCNIYEFNAYTVDGYKLTLVF